MRERVQRLAVLMAILAVTASVGATMLLTVATLRSSEQQMTQLEADWLNFEVRDRLQHGAAVDSDFIENHLHNASAVKIEFDGKTVQWRDGQADPATIAVSESGGVRVTVEHGAAELVFAIAQSLLLAMGLGVAMAGAAWLLVRRWMQRIQPVFDDFVHTASALGSGDGRARGKRYGLQEFDKVAEVLDKTSERLEQTLMVERRLVSEASHQLRTPMTALSLQIEEIGEVAERPDEVRELAAQAQRQVDRLAAVVQELIEVRRGGEQSATPQPLLEMLGSVLAEHRKSLEAERRWLQVDVPAQMQTFAAPGAVKHILGILLENARVHGAGKVSVEAFDNKSWVVLAVADEGPGLSESAARLLTTSDRGQVEVEPKSIGLPLAAALAAAQGGRLEWRANQPSTLRVYLPS